MKWLAVHVGDQLVTVHIVDRKRTLKGLEGAYYPNRARIDIARDLDREARNATLFHELEHAVNEASGATKLLTDAVAPTLLEKLDEDITRARAPMWNRLLRDLGFHLPKGPYE